MYKFQITELTIHRHRFTWANLPQGHKIAQHSYYILVRLPLWAIAIGGWIIFSLQNYSLIVLLSITVGSHGTSHQYIIIGFYGVNSPSKSKSKVYNTKFTNGWHSSPPLSPHLQMKIQGAVFSEFLLSNFPIDFHSKSTDMKKCSLFIFACRGRWVMIYVLIESPGSALERHPKTSHPFCTAFKYCGQRLPYTLKSQWDTWKTPDFRFVSTIEPYYQITITTLYQNL